MASEIKETNQNRYFKWTVTLVCFMALFLVMVWARAFYGAMETIQERTKEDPMKVFRRALDNVKPALEVKSRRVGGSNYQVPIEVRPQRRTALAMRWLISYARQRPEKSMKEKLANELMDAASARGAAFKKKEDTHRMAEANKAFAHYRW